ncbi:hypothetical protein AgCh_005138 [Apium graveolens]
MNYGGAVSISAYCDTNRISAYVQQALNSTGIALNHVPAEVKGIQFITVGERGIVRLLYLYAVMLPSSQGKEEFTEQNQLFYKAPWAFSSTTQLVVQ